MTPGLQKKEKKPIRSLFVVEILYIDWHEGKLRENKVLYTFNMNYLHLDKAKKSDTGADN